MALQHGGLLETLLDKLLDVRCLDLGGFGRLLVGSILRGVWCRLITAFATNGLTHPLGEPSRRW